MKQKISGNKNVVAGRDVIIKTNEISNKISKIYDEYLKPAFELIDKRVIDIFPEGLTSPTTPDKKINFSSEKLFTSLTQIGVPINVALYAITRTEPKLAKLSQNQSKLSTDDIRWAIANSLYQYEPFGYCDKKRQFWGDKYVRIYGNPSQPFIVITNDGSPHDLNYKYLLKTILPHLMELIWGIKKFGSSPN